MEIEDEALDILSRPGVFREKYPDLIKT